MKREPLNAAKAPGPKPVINIKPGGGKHSGGGILPTIKPKGKGNK